MKTWRVWLLLLLALLLPLRGALAAGVLCPAAGSGHAQAGVVAAHDHASHGHAASATAVHPQPAAHGHAAHEAGGAGAANAAHAAHEAGDTCNQCSAFCSAPALVSSCTPQFRAAEPAGAEFPQPAARLPSFVREGPERPPRNA